MGEVAGPEGAALLGSGSSFLFMLEQVMGHC